MGKKNAGREKGKKDKEKRKKRKIKDETQRLKFTWKNNDMNVVIKSVLDLELDLVITEGII